MLSSLVERPEAHFPCLINVSNPCSRCPGRFGANADLVSAVRDGELGRIAHVRADRTFFERDGLEAKRGQRPLGAAQCVGRERKTYITIDRLSRTGGFGEQQQIVEEVRLQLSPALVLLDLSFAEDTSRAEQTSRRSQVEPLRQSRGLALEECKFLGRTRARALDSLRLRRGIRHYQKATPASLSSR